MSDKSGLAVFEVFPEIERLGEATLQRLCDDWKATAIAKEFAVSYLAVDDKLRLYFQCELNHELQNGEVYYFPIDRLLIYIAENGISDVNERETAKLRISAARERGGPDVFSRFKLNPGSKMPLFITCSNCSEVLQTQYTAYRCQKIRFEREEIECPVCHKLISTNGSEFHFEP
jgi:hypothetical protein